MTTVISRDNKTTMPDARKWNNIDNYGALLAYAGTHVKRRKYRKTAAKQHSAAFAEMTQKCLCLAQNVLLAAVASSVHVVVFAQYAACEQTPTPLLFQNFWIRIRVRLFFQFKNPTPVETPAIIIDPTIIYPCFNLRNNRTDSCYCRNGKVTPDEI